MADNMGADVQILLSDNVPEDARDALALLAITMAFCRTAKRMGLTKEEAVERAGNAVAAAWED